MGLYHRDLVLVDPSRPSQAKAGGNGVLDRRARRSDTWVEGLDSDLAVVGGADNLDADT